MQTNEIIAKMMLIGKKNPSFDSNSPFSYISLLRRYIFFFVLFFFNFYVLNLLSDSFNFQIFWFIFNNN